MNPERLTLRSQQAMTRAQALAKDHHNQHVEAEHLLLALFEDPEGMAPAIALKVGADAQKIQRELKQSVQDVPKVSGSGAGQLYVGDSLRKLYDKAEAAATKLNDQYISAEHFL